MKSLANSGAPDHAGTRSESWHETNRHPTAFFRQRRGEPWKPDVTLTSEQIQERMNTDLDWMTRHVSTIARSPGLHDPAREWRQAERGPLHDGRRVPQSKRSPTWAYITNKGSYGREEKLIRLSPPIEAALVRYVRDSRGPGSTHRRANASLNSMILSPFFSPGEVPPTLATPFIITGVVSLPHDRPKKREGWSFRPSNTPLMTCAICASPSGLPTSGRLSQHLKQRCYDAVSNGAWPGEAHSRSSVTTIP